MSLSPELQKMADKVKPTVYERTDVSENIVRLRKRMGWTQRELALKLKTSHSRVAGWEQPVTEMTLNTLQKLADIFGVKMADLLSPPRANYTGTKITQARFTPAQEVSDE